MSRSMIPKLAILACTLVLLGKSSAAASRHAGQNVDIKEHDQEVAVLEKFRANPNVWSALQEESEVKPDLTFSAAGAEKEETNHYHHPDQHDVQVAPNTNHQAPSPIPAQQSYQYGTM